MNIDARRMESFKDVIEDNKNVQGIDDDNMLDIMSMLQDVEVDLILADLEISKVFSIL